MKTQLETIKDILIKKGGISRNTCLDMRITRLSSIIQDLESEGFEFESFYGKARRFKKENWKNYYYVVKKIPERKLL